METSLSFGFTDGPAVGKLTQPASTYSGLKRKIVCMQTKCFSCSFSHAQKKTVFTPRIHIEQKWQIYSFLNEIDRVGCIYQSESGIPVYLQPHTWFFIRWMKQRPCVHIWDLFRNMSIGNWRVLPSKKEPIWKPQTNETHNHGISSFAVLLSESVLDLFE